MPKAFNTIHRKSASAVGFVRISKLARKVRRDGLTYLSPIKLFHIEREIKRVNKEGPVGDFAEFGVALGGSAIILASQLGGRRRFHGFDVFGMIPPPTNEKDGEISIKRFEEISQGKSVGFAGQDYYGYRDDLFESVKESFSDNGINVDEKRVFLHQGLFEETWPMVEETVRAFSLVHIDCDWYDPVKFCLYVGDEKLVTGGSMIVDDYYAYEGARAATDEFLENNRNYKVTTANWHLIITKTF